MILDDLEGVLTERRRDLPTGSYSVALFADPARIARKINEEAYELCAELTAAERDRGRVVEEAADLLFHILVGLVDAGVPLSEVLGELEARRR